MFKAYFGKDFKVPFNYSIDAIPANNTPTIYVFKEKPSKDEAQTGTSSYLVGSSITAWTDANTKENCKMFSVPAISDPNPDSDEYEKVYYIAINYKLQSGAQDQLVIKPFIITRVNANISIPEVDPLDVVRICPMISTYIDTNRIDDWINQAIIEVKSFLKRRGFNWDKIVNLDELNYAIGLKAIALAQYDEFEQDGDKFRIRAKDFESKFIDQMEGLIIKFDDNIDGTVDKTAEKTSFFIINSK